MKKNFAADILGDNAPTTTKPKPVVVVIDDDEAVLAGLKIALARTFTVETYTDPEHGAKAAQKPGVSLVIIDVKMPKRDGFWVFATIRERAPRLPVIFNSAYQDAKLPEEVQSLYRPFAFLQKNGNLTEFMSMVGKAMQSIQP